MDRCFSERDVHSLFEQPDDLIPFFNEISKCLSQILEFDEEKDLTELSRYLIQPSFIPIRKAIKKIGNDDRRDLKVSQKLFEIYNMFYKFSTNFPDHKFSSILVII